MSRDDSRLQYLDAIRGWAVFIVVWVHSTWLMLGADTCWLYSFAVVYPMPLFFAVSGFLRGTKGCDKLLPWRRWLKLFFLLVAGSCGYAMFFGESIADMFGAKYYYWFFAALLLSEIIAAILLPLLHSREGVVKACVGASAFWLFCLCMEKYCGANRYGIPWADMEQYWLFYWLGVLMSTYPRLQYILTGRMPAAAGALLLSASLITWQDAGTFYGLAGGLGGVVLTWHLFRSMEGRMRVIAWLGRMSLGIFLLSYPLLRALQSVGALVPRWLVESQWQWFIGFATAIPLTLVMAVFWQSLQSINVKCLTYLGKK